MTADECINMLLLTAASRRQGARKQTDKIAAAAMRASADDIESIARTLKRMHEGWGDDDETPACGTPIGGLGEKI